MKNYRLTLFSFFLMLGVAIAGCEKDEGPVGPQGPQGTQGPEGPQGPTGNANVQSQTITVSPADWNDEGTWYSTIMPCDIITEEIQESGAVMAYHRSFDNSIYTALPVSAMFIGDTVTTHMGFEHSVNEVYFFIQTDEGITPAPGSRTFKVVAIESSGLAANPGLNLKDYEEVEQAFNLAD